MPSSQKSWWSAALCQTFSLLQWQTSFGRDNVLWKHSQITVTDLIRQVQGCVNHMLPPRSGDNFLCEVNIVWLSPIAIIIKFQSNCAFQARLVHLNSISQSGHWVWLSWEPTAMSFMVKAALCLLFVRAKCESLLWWSYWCDFMGLSTFTFY